MIALEVKCKANVPIKKKIFLPNVSKYNPTLYVKNDTTQQSVAYHRNAWLVQYLRINLFNPVY